MYLDYPSYCSVMLSGPPGVGKLECALELVRHNLNRHERSVLVTLDVSPPEVRGLARGIGLDLERHEGTDFVFVDCYSASASERHEATSQGGQYAVSSFSNLEGIGMTLSRAAHEMRTPVRIYFYTVSTLFLHNSHQAIARFLQIITSRVKTNLGSIMYAVHDGVHDPTTMNLLRSLVDGVVEMRFNEAMQREIRIHHLRGTAANARWERFQPIEAASSVQGAV